MSKQRPSYDVVILGSGIAGSTLGAVLARAGVKVLLADAATHPRFAVGESMIPQLVSWLQILAERYDVPELKALTDATVINEQISNTFDHNLVVGNRISIVADDFANGHFTSMKYVIWDEVYWKVSSVEVQRPRLILSLGGVYNGNKA